MITGMNAAASTLACPSASEQNDVPHATEHPLARKRMRRSRLPETCEASSAHGLPDSTKGEQHRKKGREHEHILDRRLSSTLMHERRPLRAALGRPRRFPSQTPRPRPQSPPSLPLPPSPLPHGNPSIPRPPSAPSSPGSPRSPHRRGTARTSSAHAPHSPTSDQPDQSNRHGQAPPRPESGTLLEPLSPSQPRQGRPRAQR